MSTKKKTAKRATTKTQEKPRKRVTTAPKTKKADKKPAPTIQPQPQPKPTTQTPIPPKPKETSIYLVIRIRGPFGVPVNLEQTMQTLRLRHKFNATLIDKNPSMLGMLRHVKDYVTWGEANVTDIANLLRERGEVNTGNRLSDQYVKDVLAQQSIDSLANAIANGEFKLKTLWQKGIKPIFRLHPPSGGFTGTMKRPFNSRGELGYRHTAISTLMSKMA